MNTTGWKTVEIVAQHDTINSSGELAKNTTTHLSIAFWRASHSLRTSYAWQNTRMSIVFRPWNPCDKYASSGRHMRHARHHRQHGCTHTHVECDTLLPCCSFDIGCVCAMCARWTEQRGDGDKSKAKIAYTQYFLFFYLILHSFRHVNWFGGTMGGKKTCLDQDILYWFARRTHNGTTTMTKKNKI